MSVTAVNISTTPLILPPEYGSLVIPSNGNTTINDSISGVLTTFAAHGYSTTGWQFTTVAVAPTIGGGADLTPTSGIATLAGAAGAAGTTGAVGTVASVSAGAGGAGTGSSGTGGAGATASLVAGAGGAGTASGAAGVGGASSLTGGAGGAGGGTTGTAGVGGASKVMGAAGGAGASSGAAGAGGVATLLGGSGGVKASGGTGGAGGNAVVQGGAATGSAANGSALIKDGAGNTLFQAGPVSLAAVLGGGGPISFVGSELHTRRKYALHSTFSTNTADMILDITDTSAAVVVQLVGMGSTTTNAAIVMVKDRSYSGAYGDALTYSITVKPPLGKNLDNVDNGTAVILNGGGRWIGEEDESGHWHTILLVA